MNTVRKFFKFRMITPVWPVLVCCYLLSFSSTARADWDSRWTERILNETIRNYDNRVIPLWKGKPLKLELRIFLLNLADLRPIDSHVSTELILHSSWVDHRLQFNAQHANSCRITGDGIKLLWTPDILFISEKTGRQSTVTKRNIFGKISSSGKVVTSERYYITHYCDMNFFFYPFDEQICDIQLTSYAYSKEWLNVSWIVEKPILSPKQTKTSGKFYLTDVEAKRVVENNYMFGNYDVLILRMKLRRKDTTLILRIYVPLTVMVIMSWLCFFIDYQSVPARTTMSAALVLTVITFISSIQQELPRAPTGRIVDIHMLVCFLYIFAGLVEYSFLRSIVIESTKRSKKHGPGGDKATRRKQSAEYATTVSAVRNVNETAQGLGKVEEKATDDQGKKKRRSYSLNHKLQKIHLRGDNRYHILDRISMVCFPLSFTLYCIVYFCYVKYGQ